MKKVFLIVSIVLSWTAHLEARTQSQNSHCSLAPMPLTLPYSHDAGDSVLVLAAGSWDTVGAQPGLSHAIHLDTARYANETGLKKPESKLNLFVWIPLVLLCVFIIGIIFVRIDKLRNRHGSSARHHKDPYPPLKTTEQINDMIDKLAQKNGGSVSYKNRNHEVTIVVYKNKEMH